MTNKERFVLLSIFISVLGFSLFSAFNPLEQHVGKSSLVVASEYITKAPVLEEEYGDYDFFENRNDCLIITYGRLFAEAGFAAKKTDASVLKLDKIFPIDETVVKKAAQFKNIFFVQNVNRQIRRDMILS